MPRTYSNRKVLKGREGPSLENRMSIEGSHSGGNEKNRGPKRLPMGCSGSQRGLKERKRELFAGGGPGYWQDPLFAGGGPGYWQKTKPLFAVGGPGYWQKPLLLEVQPDTDKYGCVPIPMPMSPYPDPHAYVPIPDPNAYVPIPRSPCRSLNLPPKPDAHIPVPIRPDTHAR